MSSVISVRSIAVESYPVDLMFDLDLALSLPENYSAGRSAEPAENTTPEFPTVGSTQACPVCLDHFPIDEGGKQTPCGHVYHSACILRWLSLGNSCPMCRRQISGVRSPETLKQRN